MYKKWTGGEPRPQKGVGGHENLNPIIFSQFALYRTKICKKNGGNGNNKNGNNAKVNGLKPEHNLNYKSTMKGIKMCHIGKHS